MAGVPSARNFGHSVLVTTRDARGNGIRDQFFDTRGRPALTRDGYAEVRMEYDARDNCTSVSYFDTKGQPTHVESGYHALKTEFDGDREFRRTYADVLGRPVDIVHGYAERLTSYEEGGAVARYQHFTAGGEELKPLQTCPGRYEGKAKAALSRAFSKLGVCVPKADSPGLLLRFNLDEQGRVTAFVPVGSRLDDAARACVRKTASTLQLPPAASGCANVTVELSRSVPRKVRVVTFGDERVTERPPG